MFVAPPRTPSGSHYVTRETAQRAVALASPMIEAARGDPGIVGSGFLHVVVMDPGLPPGVAGFDEAVLYERSFGDPTLWDADYAAFARAKARLSWATGMDGHRLQTLSPHLLKGGDTLLAGGVCLDGIVVAASGAFACYDEAFAGSIALCLRALARAGREGDSGRTALEAPADADSRARHPGGGERSP